MKTQNYNKRTCIIDKKKYFKTELIRIVFLNNKLIIDHDKTIKSRGCYINIKNLHKINIIYKKKLFNRAFKNNISEKEYIKIINNLKE